MIISAERTRDSVSMPPGAGLTEHPAVVEGPAGAVPPASTAAQAAAPDRAECAAAPEVAPRGFEDQLRQAYRRLGMNNPLSIKYDNEMSAAEWREAYEPVYRYDLPVIMAQLTAAGARPGASVELPAREHALLTVLASARAAVLYDLASDGSLTPEQRDFLLVARAGRMRDLSYFRFWAWMTPGQHYYAGRVMATAENGKTLTPEQQRLLLFLREAQSDQLDKLEVFVEWDVTRGDPAARWMGQVFDWSNLTATQKQAAFSTLGPWRGGPPPAVPTS